MNDVLNSWPIGSAGTERNGTQKIHTFLTSYPSARATCDAILGGSPCKTAVLRKLSAAGINCGFEKEYAVQGEKPRIKKLDYLRSGAIRLDQPGVIQRIRDSGEGATILSCLVTSGRFAQDEVPLTDACLDAIEKEVDLIRKRTQEVDPAELAKWHSRFLVTCLLCQDRACKQRCTEKYQRVFAGATSIGSRILNSYARETCPDLYDLNFGKGIPTKTDDANDTTNYARSRSGMRHLLWDGRYRTLLEVKTMPAEVRLATGIALAASSLPRGRDARRTAMQRLLLDGELVPLFLDVADEVEIKHLELENPSTP